MTDYKKYNNVKLGLNIAKGIAGFLLLIAFLWFGYSAMFADYLRRFTTNNYVLFLLFTFGAGAGSAIIFSPLSFYTDFYLEHKYNLSNQTFMAFLWENAKGIMLGPSYWRSAFISVLLCSKYLRLFVVASVCNNPYSSFQ